MADPVAVELQRAIYSVLTGDAFKAAIAPLVFPVFDRVPNGQKPNYIKIGDAHDVGDEAAGYAGSLVTETITAWGGLGKPDVAKIAGAIRTFLAPVKPGPAPFILPSHRLVTWTFEGAQFLDDTDGVSVKGVVLITYDTFPTA